MAAVLDTTREAAALLARIGEFCRAHSLAESTFGRLAVNDGKFVARLRDGGRVREATLARVEAFLQQPPPTVDKPFVVGGARPEAAAASESSAPTPSTPAARPRPPSAPAPDGGSQTNFRFYDNRQKYLLFVNTCSEKSVVAQRVGMELANIHPQPPAVRVFDAGVGDGTVLSRVMREMHRRFPTMPFYLVGKEISLEDVRLALDKMADRFFEHPSSVLILTNLYYSEAPWLTPKSVQAASSMIWHEVALAGSTAHEFEQQINALNPFLSQHWTVRASPATGNPLYERPIVLVLYREDYKFLLHDVIPKPGKVRADYDLVIASQPYRLRVPAEFKAQKVLAPLARALGPGGRLIGIHSAGGDPGLELVQRVWPGENPYRTDRHQLLRVLKAELGSGARNLNFNAYADARSMFRYDMHTLPTEIGNSIGTSTLFAAWNAAVYVAQIEDQRLAEALTGGRYLDATRETLQRHGGLWFNDESFVVSRPRD
jgi:SAM-dependent methyltransferase